MNTGSRKIVVNVETPDLPYTSYRQTAYEKSDKAESLSNDGNLRDAAAAHRQAKQYHEYAAHSAWTEGLDQKAIAHEGEAEYHEGRAKLLMGKV